MPPPFELTLPTSGEVPVIVEVPHASLVFDAEAAALTTAPMAALGHDADLYVDELFQDAAEEGARLIVSHRSRYYTDLNRAEEDIDPVAVEGAPPHVAPRGLIWHTTTEGDPALSQPLSRGELERRMELLYRPYHACVTTMLREVTKRFGFAILLSAHSMPSNARRDPRSPGEARADVVPGSRGGTTAGPTVIRALDGWARSYGWSVQHDTPYRGGNTTARYGTPGADVHAIQLELARRLYMREDTLARRQGAFDEVRARCRELVQRLGRLDLRAG